MKDENGNDFRWSICDRSAKFIGLIYLRRNGRRLSRPELRRVVGDSCYRAVARQEYANRLKVYVDPILGVKFVVNDERKLCVSVYDDTATEWNGDR